MSDDINRLPTVPPPPPLHPSVGAQLLFLEGVEPLKTTPRLISFSRESLEKIWRILHELNEVASNPEKYQPVDCDDTPHQT